MSPYKDPVKRRECWRLSQQKHRDNQKKEKSLDTTGNKGEKP